MFMKSTVLVITDMQITIFVTRKKINWKFYEDMIQLVNVESLYRIVRRAVVAMLNKQISHFSNITKVIYQWMVRGS